MAKAAKAAFKRRSPVVKGRSTQAGKEIKVVKVRISASVDLAAKLVLERIAAQQGRSPSNALNMILLRAGELAFPGPTEAQAASKPVNST